jgi:hypothetical protein
MTFPSDTGLVAASIPHNQKEANGRIRDPQVGQITIIWPRRRLLHLLTCTQYCLKHSP